MGSQVGNITRLIPAHAGKTVLAIQLTICAWAHPRSRGENLVDKPNVLAALGSSPLTRGKLGMVREGMFAAGLIPAHAGKTAHRWPRSAQRWAHPRSRGENIKAAVSVVVEWGSSPLTRGKHGALTPRETVQRLIPAHAGKT